MQTSIIPWCSHRYCSKLWSILKTSFPNQHNKSLKSAPEVESCGEKVIIYRGVYRTPWIHSDEHVTDLEWHIGKKDIWELTYILELLIFNFQNVSLQCALWFSPTWLLQLHSPNECHPHPSQFPIKNCQWSVYCNFLPHYRSFNSEAMHQEWYEDHMCVCEPGRHQDARQNSISLNFNNSFYISLELE